LTVDNITMTDHTLSVVYNAIKEMVDASSAITHDVILRSEDTDVIRVVSDIMAEPFPLHKWSKVGVDITSFDFVAATYTRDLILRYKDMHVSMMIDEALKNMNEEGVTEEQRITYMEQLKQLTATRVLLNKELGNRVI
ncbi:MAG: hypothetical protein PHD21_06035, partial [Flavobacteriales bacterium]|nr:hypothetical protein [Flavobacteriales bacterium]